MPYTVWCNDRLVGESDLDYIANSDDHWTGDFVPTPYGEQIIPILMGPRKAIVAHDDAALREVCLRVAETCMRREPVASDAAAVVAEVLGKERAP